MARRYVLKDAPDRRIVRIGNTVRRPTNSWTPAVHALLRHLEASGFIPAPRALGIDEDEREILTYIPGRSGAHGWAMIIDDRGLQHVARLLRAYHDAVRSFRPPVGAIWAYTDSPTREGEIICHGDFGPWNLVWRRGHPVGIIDWDHAGPGPAIDDVAYALEYVIPFRDDETALRWLAYERPPNRRHRLELFASAYGLTTATGLIDHVIRRQRLTLERVRALGELGAEPQATWVADGYLKVLESRVNWTERHRPLFE